MGKNVAVFVDVANIFYAAKAAGVDIDYVTLLKSAVAGRDFVRAYAYTGLDPENENQRNFHQFLARHGYKVVSKDIRKYGDGKVKANLDIELVVDMMKTSRNLDVAIVVSGDGDFAPAIRAVQEQGVRVEVISFRGNTSSDLIDVADIFTDITQIAKVEKGSRSGRRVAGDEADLSMTEVPEKQTEGPSRGRGRGRGRTRTHEPEPVAATSSTRRASGAAALTVLPGERLSKAVPGEAAAVADTDVATEEEVADAVGSAADANGTAGDEVDAEGRRRRRRRRGGRGRGRGRGGETDALAVGSGAARDEAEVEDEDEEAPAAVLASPPAPRMSSFGSVWDSQLGVPTGPAPQAPGRSAPSADEEDDFEEPEIPEYLIAEQRRGQAGRGRAPGGQPGRGGRGRNSAYAAALDRERFGGGRGSTVSRYAEPQRGGRPNQAPPPRRDERQAPRPQPRSTEPWSEVPPELEQMLRSQLGGRPNADDRSARRPVDARPVQDATHAASTVAPATQTVAAPPATAEGAETPAPAPRRRGGRRPASEADVAATASSESATPELASETPRRRTTRRTTTAVSTEPAAATEAAPIAETAAETPKRRTTRRAKATDAPVTDEAAGASDGADAATDVPAPKPRTRRRTPAPSGE